MSWEKRITERSHVPDDVCLGHAPCFFGAIHQKQ